MSLNRRKAFFRARAGNSDANAQAIIDGLRKLGHFVVPIRSSDAGVPDLCVFPRAIAPRWTYDGSALEIRQGDPYPVWVEVKTAKGRAAKSQLEWRARALNAGLRVVTARTLDECLEALR